MQPQWPAPIRLFLLIPALLCLSVPAKAQTSAEAAPGALAQGIEEPQIALPEVPNDSKFQGISRTREVSKDPLIQLCQEAVDVASRRMLSTEQHTPWQMMHALLGLRQDFRMMHDGQVVTGLDWVTEGQIFDNEYWFERTRFGGRAHPYSRPYAFEGHANQFLAILSMCGVSLDQEFGTKNGPITMREMIKHAQMTVNTKDEPTWTLWALSRYLPPTARWRNQNGEMWSIERLVQLQCTKPIQRGAPCGGTHALFALAHARNVYQREGKPLRGTWMQAQYKIRQFTNMARMQQNSNGSLSSNFFRGRSYNPDYNKRMASVGHVLEFLMIALPQNELNSRWVRRAIESTARDLMNNRKAYVKCSPLYHSVDALNIYLDRVNPRVTPSEEPIVDVDVPPETKTAELPATEQSPRIGGLKPVPITSISRPKEVPAASADDESMEIAATEPGTLPPAVVESPEKTDATVSVDAAASLPLVADESLAVAADRDREKWQPTPAGRRQPIVVAEVADASTAVAQKVEPLPAAEEMAVPSAEGDLPAVEDVVDSTPVTVTEDEVDEEAATDLPIEPVDEVETETKTAEPAPMPVELKEMPITEVEEAEAEAEAEAEEVEVEAPLGIPVTSVSTSKVLDGVEEPGISESQITSDKYLAVGSNDVFQNPELNVREWQDTFESEQRGVYRVRDRIVDALNLTDGMDVADVGAGTGAFVGLLSDKVGPAGRVFAIDLSPRFIDYMEELVHLEELHNVDVVRNEPTSLMLMRHKVDRLLVCDSFNYFEQPEAMLQSMFNALRAGGEIVLVETERIPGTSSDAVLERVRAGKQTFKDEFVMAGFEYIGEVDVPGLQQNYVLRFRKPGQE